MSQADIEQEVDECCQRIIALEAWLSKIPLEHVENIAMAMDQIAMLQRRVGMLTSQAA